MEEVVKVVALEALRLTAERPSSGHVDPRPLQMLVDAVSDGCELARLCIDVYNHARPPGARPPRWQTRERRRVEPWRTYRESDWQRHREAVFYPLIRNYEALAAGMEVRRESTSEQRALGTSPGSITYRPTELIYLLTAHLLECARLTAAPEGRALINAAPPETSSVRSEDLLLYGHAIGQYTVSETLESLLWLCTRFNDLRYDRDLLDHVGRLEFRVARILTHPASAAVHDAPLYRQPLPRPSGVATAAPPAQYEQQYVPNVAFVSAVTSVMCALETQLIAATRWPRVSPEAAKRVVSEERRDAYLAWSLGKARAVATRLPSDWLRDMYVASALFPAERELFTQLHPNDSTAALSILKAHRAGSAGAGNPLLKRHRPAQYARIVADAEQPPSVVIERELPRPRHLAEPPPRAAAGESKRAEGAADDEPPWKQRAPGDRRESRLLQLALFEQFSRAFRQLCRGSDWALYGKLEQDLALSEEEMDLASDVPRVIQCFHHFSLYIDGQIVAYDSFVDSACAWIAAMAEPPRDRALTKRITTAALESEIFGTGERPRPSKRQRADGGAPTFSV
jgi:hypothetical protein